MKKLLFLSICMVCVLMVKAQYTNPATCLAVVEKDGKRGLLSCTGQLITAAQYDDIKILENGYSFLETADKKGFANPAGKVTLLEGVSEIIELTNGVIHATLPNKRHAFYDTAGKRLFQQDYLLAQGFHAGVALVYNQYDKAKSAYINGKYINKKGEVVFDFANARYPYSFTIHDMYDGLARIDVYYHPDKNANPRGPSGFINAEGKLAIAPQFSIYHGMVGQYWPQDYHFSGDYCLMPDCPNQQSCYRLGFIDKKGNWKIRGLYSAYPFDNNGLAFYTDSLGSGYLKTDFTPLYPNNQYWKVSVSFGGGNVSPYYSEGMIPVNKKGNNEYGYLTLDGQEAFFMPANSYVSYYRDGVAMVTKRNEKQEVVYALVDKKGAYVTEFAKLPSPVYTFMPVPAGGIVVYDTDSSHKLLLNNTVVQEIKKTSGYYMKTTSCGLLKLEKGMYVSTDAKGTRFFNENTGTEIGAGYTFITDFTEIFPDKANTTDIQKLQLNPAELIDYLKKYFEKMGINPEE